MIEHTSRGNRSGGARQGGKFVYLDLNASIGHLSGLPAKRSGKEQTQLRANQTIRFFLHIMLNFSSLAEQLVPHGVESEHFKTKLNYLEGGIYYMWSVHGGNANSFQLLLSSFLSFLPPEPATRLISNPTT